VRDRSLLSCDIIGMSCAGKELYYSASRYLVEALVSAGEVFMMAVMLCRDV
jgi:hypothetical protein